MIIILKRIIGLFLDFLTLFDFVFSTRRNSIQLAPDFSYEYESKVALYVTHISMHKDIFESNLLEALRLMGFHVIVVINRDISECVSTLRNPILRENLSSDLGAVRDFLHHFSKNQIQEIFIFNSSMAYFKNIDNFLQSVRQGNDTKIVVGVQSFQKLMHFQSFFFYASGSGVASLNKSFQGIRNYRYKRTLINFGEILISRKLLKAGCTLRVMFPYSRTINRKVSLMNRLGIAQNPTIDCAEQLLDLGAPFAKRRHPRFTKLQERSAIYD